ncbi:hypothetical protein [Streptomyces sp. gb14]|uniref:hypothetical protein n=1 Tax=Streptomyces sp. gb14 TaxID=1827753 RepID=UPI000BF1E71D|nr:hypothetical protein [Streptomyces sp. gb14]
MAQTSNVIGDRPLNRIVMPGAHDAGSWSITDTSGICDSGDAAATARKAPQIAAAVSITQAGPITAQLDAGARHLDLRLCKQGGRWYTYHGGPTGNIFFGRQGEVQDVARWIRDHPQEVVTIELSLAVPADSNPSQEIDTAAEDREQAVELLGSAIGTDRMADSSKLSPASTYNEFVDAGANAVLIDTTNSTGHPWAWHGTTLTDLGSYVYQNKFGEMFKDVFKNLGKNDAVIDRISRIAIDRDDEVLRTERAGAEQFFKLQGVVDSTLTIPDAAADVFTHGANYKPDGLPYMLYLAREHNERLLPWIRGPWHTSNIARNTNIVMIDFINMGGPGNDEPSGFVAAAIIANNTPTTAPGTLLSSERRADGSWGPVEALPGAYTSMEFEGGERAMTAMPDGSVQFLAYGLDRRIYHNIRRSDGTWQGWLPVANAADPRLSGGRLAMTAASDGTMHALTIGDDGYLRHTLRHPDGTWQETWAVVTDRSQPVKARDVAATTQRNGTLEIFVLDTSGVMRTTQRWSVGAWNTWQTVRGIDMEATFVGTDLAVSTLPDGTLQIAAVGSGGYVWHTTRDARGVNKPWGRPDFLPNDLMRATDVALATGSDGTSQLAVIGLDGAAWQNTRRANGSWAGYQVLRGGFGDPLGATGLALAPLSGGRFLTLVSSR